MRENHVEKRSDLLKILGFFCLKKCGEKRGFEQQNENSVFSTGIHKLSTPKIVEKPQCPLVLVVMLEVMSRITPAMAGSFLIRSSTLRIEESTVV